MKKRIKWHDLVSAESEDGTFDFVQDLNGKDIRLYMFTPIDDKNEVMSKLDMNHKQWKELVKLIRRIS